MGRCLRISGRVPRQIFGIAVSFGKGKSQGNSYKDSNFFTHVFLYITVGISLNVTYYSNFHPKNFLLGFGFTPITVQELLAKDKALSVYSDPARSFYEHTLDDVEKVRIYQS